MNEMKYWQKAMTDDEGNRVLNPNYILRPDNPRRFRMPLKLSAKAKGYHYWGDDKKRTSGEIGRLVCDPDRNILPEENSPIGIRLRVECTAHVDYFQARAKDVKAAIRKVKKEHNGEPFVAILKNTRRGEGYGDTTSLDFAFLDTDERIPKGTYNHWGIRRMIPTIYTYADLIARLTAIADHLASVDAESETRRLAIQNARRHVESQEDWLERQQKDLKRAEQSYADWTDEEFVRQYVGRQVGTARGHVAGMLEKVAKCEEELAKAKQKFAALTGEEE